MNYQILRDTYTISEAVYKHNYVTNAMELEDLIDRKGYLLFFRTSDGYFQVAPVYLRNLVRKQWYNFVQKLVNGSHCNLSVTHGAYLKTWFIVQSV